MKGTGESDMGARGDPGPQQLKKGIMQTKLKVKCLYEGFYNNSRIAKGEVFYIQDKSEFSHLWMNAMGWTPDPPTELVAAVMDTVEHKAKAKKFVPFDAKTHGKRNARPGESAEEEFDHKAPPDGEVVDEDEDQPKKVKSGPRAGKDVI